MINLTAQGSGYYIVTVGGVDTTQHVTEREAIESAVNQEQANPTAVVTYRHDYIVRVEQAADPVPTPIPDPVPVPAPTPAPIPTPVANLFTLPFSVLQHSFEATRGPKDGVKSWNYELIEDFIRFYRWADINGDTNAGFTFSPAQLLPSPFAGLSPGPFYLRFRMRVVAPLGNGGHAAGMKFFIFGGPGISGERRMIMFLKNGLIFDDNGIAIGGSITDYTTVAMSAGVSGNRVSALIPNGEIVDVQISYGYTGSPGGPFMRIYVNNNDEANPTAEHNTFTADGMGGAWIYPEGWDTGFWGNIDSNNSTTDLDAIIDVKDFQFSSQFDPNWSA